MTCLPHVLLPMRPQSAARNSEDSVQVHVAGLPQTPRAELPGVRKIGGVERDFDAAPLGIHAQMRSSSVANFERDQQLAQAIGGSGERADCKHWCRRGVHCPLTNVVADPRKDKRFQPSKVPLWRYPKPKPQVPMMPECQGCSFCLAPASEPSDLWLRLAGYEMRCAARGPPAASTQAYL